MKHKECVMHIGMHKTGSSSIQEALSEIETSDTFHYVKLGESPNHGGKIFTIFTEVPEKYHAWTKLGLSKDEVGKIIAETQKQLIKNFTEVQAETFFISGEDIVNLSKEGLIKLKTFLEPYFSNITIVGYVRSPQSYIESAFQQSIKGFLNTFNLDAMYPHYRDKFEKFDQVFGSNNVILRHFSPSSIYKNNVVLDICALFDIKAEKTVLKRANSSLSKEAVSLLYTYRKYGPEYGQGKDAIRENNTMIFKLSEIGNTKFSLSFSLIKPILDKHRDDLQWIEDKLNTSFKEEKQENGNDVVSEEDLLNVTPETIQSLKEIIRKKYLPVGLNGNTPLERALLVQTLRLKIAERYANKLKQEAVKNFDTVNTTRGEPNRDEASMVLKGKNNYLFLIGGRHQVLKLLTNEKKPNNDSVIYFWNNIKMRHSFCKNKKILYKHFIFPDKLYLLRDKLSFDPISLYNTHYEPENQMNKEVCYLNFHEEQSASYYYKTDTHLNIFGNLKVIESMIESSDDFTLYKKSIEKSLYVKWGWCGDLGIKLSPPVSENCIEYNFRLNSHAIREYHNGLVGGNNGIIHIFINDQPLYNQKLLIFGDSFFRALLKHLTFFYKEVVFCKTPFFHKEVVDMYDPDIVYSGNTERYLSNVKSDNKADNFFRIPLTENKQINFDERFSNTFLDLFKVKYSNAIHGELK